MAQNDNQDQRIQELVKELAVLKQTMETHKQEYKTDIARLAEQMADWKTDMAKRDIEMADWKTDMARRDKSNMQWIAGFVLGSAVLVIAVLGLLLTSTPSP